MSDMPGVIPVHEPAQDRWTVALDGQRALLEYTLEDGVMTIRHTEVPKALGGRGIAGDLVRAAMDFARAGGYRVRPACEYAMVWMARHPDYEDLRAA